MNGLADQEDLRLRFDVLTRTKQPELCRSWRQRDRAANLRLFRLVAGVLHAIEAGVFHPNPGWQCKDCPFQTGAGRGGRRAAPGKAMHAMMRVIPRSGSRKVNGQVKAVLALEAVRRKREARYVRARRAPARPEARPAGGRGRDAAAGAERLAAAQRLLAMTAQATASDGTANRE